MNPYEINNELERQLSEYTGAPYCVVLDSGTSAIILSCILHEVDEVEVALRLKRGMYIPNTHMILSFGHRKQLPIGSGGALLLDNEEEYIRLKRLRYNGRPETAYHDTDDITEIGFNMILHPILASIGVEMMKTFPDNPPDKPTSMNGLDLTKFSVFKNEES